MTPRRKTPGTQIQGIRLWTFRLAAVLLGLGLLGIAEGICRLLDLGDSSDYSPVDAGFNRANSLFVLDADGERYSIRESRRKFFLLESFPARKTRETFRIFCLGGSTVQGRPYGKETAFSRWLELSLEAADPNRNWEVINCGGVSYASYRLTPILEECLRYEPDLFILCSGHNEFLEERTYRVAKRVPRILITASDTVMTTRVGRLLMRTFQRASRTPVPHTELGHSVSTQEADALLDYRDGLKAYHRDEGLRRRTIDEFAANLERMVAMSKGAGVPIFLVLPPSNLRDAAPFKSQHRDGLAGNELAEWTRAIERASSHFSTDPLRAAEKLEEAIALDGQFAQTHYNLGKCYQALGKPELARRAFQSARELDVCPLRILEPMEETLRGISSEGGVPLIDAHRLLESRSEWNILGNDWLVDHVHPSIRGHQRIADSILEEMRRQSWIEPVSGWRGARQSRYQENFDSLDQLYFLHGKQRLENLRAWTQGRADGPPIEERIGNGS